MTPSEPGGAPGLPPPPASPPTGPATAPLPPPPPTPPITHRPIPLDQPSRTSPLTIVLELVALAGIGSGMALALLAGAVEEVVQLMIPVLFVLGRVVGWWFRTYTVTAGELVLDEGILQKHHRVVPLSRIQQVEVRQQLMARALGIATVHVETAAERGGTAVTLRALDLATAEALRDHLLAEQLRLRSGDAAAGPDNLAPVPAAGMPLPSRTPLVQLDAGDLLVAGATSSIAVLGVAAVVVAAAAGAGLLADALDTGALVAAGLFLVLTPAGSAAVVSVAAVGTAVSAWGFELSTSGDELHLRHGLFDARQHTMPRHRLQHVRVVDNPLRRRLGTVSVLLFSGATPGRGDEQQGFIEIPLVRRDALGDLLVSLMGSEDFRPPPLTPRPPAAGRRAVLRRTLLTSLLAAAVAVAAWPAGAGLIPLALVGIPWGRLAHRRAGFALDGPVVALASGALVHRLDLIPTARIQSARTTASPLQRRLGLATLHLDVAGAGARLDPHLGDVDERTAAAGLVAWSHALRT